MMKVLLLEDNVDLNNAIAELLTKKRFLVTQFFNGKEALERVEEGYGLFVLDINVPRVSGVDVLKKVRDFSRELPVILISADTRIDTILRGYASGASEFLKKPFDIRELDIKLDQLLSRHEQIIELYEGVTYDSVKRVLFINNEPIKLTKKERLFLHLLAENKDMTVEHKFIQEFVWGKNDEKNGCSVRSLVKRLRKKLPEDLVKNISGIGYKID